MTGAVSDPGIWTGGAACDKFGESEDGVLGVTPNPNLLPFRNFL